jgi:hypothetical protein
MLFVDGGAYGGGGGGGGGSGSGFFGAVVVGASGLGGIVGWGDAALYSDCLVLEEWMLSAYQGVLPVFLLGVLPYPPDLGNGIFCPP